MAKFIIIVLVNAIVLVPLVLETRANITNPTPKMKDRNEEKVFSKKTICKTRKMYEVEKR